MTRKRNQVAEGVYKQRCRSYKKDLDSANNQIKATTVDSIIDRYSLLKEAESIENEKQCQRSLNAKQIPTTSLRKSEEYETGKQKKSANTKTTRKPVLKRSATFVLGDLPIRSNTEVPETKSKGNPKFSISRSRTSLFDDKEEKKQDVKITSFPGLHLLSVVRLSGSAPQSKEQSKENNIGGSNRDAVSNPITQWLTKQRQREAMEVSKSASEVEAEYFHRRIDRLFSPTKMEENGEKQLDPRPQSCVPVAPNTASLRTRHFLQNTVSKYRWVLIPGDSNLDQSEKQLTKQREREKVKVRQSELASIQADLRRKETSIRRLLRRSTSIREEMSHVTTGRPPV